MSNRITEALAFAGGSHSLADIKRAVALGELQEWVGDESVIITEIKQTPQQRILLYFLAGGCMEELRAMSPAIEEWGRSLRCVKAQLIGRRGWERSPIVQDGWRPVSIVMEKSLE
jgi:hypothetical protein